MLETEQYLSFHSDFYNKLITSTKHIDRYLPYDHYEVSPSLFTGPKWFVFHNLISDLIRENLNTTNGLLTSIRRLDTWVEIFNECQDYVKHSLFFEIIDPIAIYAINMVPAVMGRFVYTSYILSHFSANLLEPENYKNGLVEENINMKSLKKFKTILPMLDALIVWIGQIDDKKFRKETRNFRNLFSHCIPLGLEYGISPSIPKFKPGGEISYGLGGSPPLKLDSIIPLLYEKHKICNRCFKEFCSFITVLIEVCKDKL